MDRQRHALIELHVATALLAGPALFAKLIHLPASTIIASRSVIAIACLVVVAMALRQRLWVTQPRTLIGLLLSGLLLGAHWITYFHAVQTSSVAVGMISLFCYPLISAVLEPVLDDAPWHPRQLVSAVAVAVGVGIMAGTPSATDSIVAGTGWGLTSAGCLALRNVTSRRLTRSATTWQVAVHQYAMAAACGAALAGDSLFDVPRHTGLLLLLGALFTALPHTLFIRSLATITATRAALVACLQPLYATIAAYLLLDEHPAAPTLVGGAIVLLVAVQASRRD